MTVLYIEKGTCVEQQSFLSVLTKLALLCLTWLVMRFVAHLQQMKPQTQSIIIQTRTAAPSTIDRPA